jgi:peptidoglycan hydrolase-like protein with peptidoglycan-binding domain
MKLRTVSSVVMGAALLVGIAVAATPANAAESTSPQAAASVVLPTPPSGGDLNSSNAQDKPIDPKALLAPASTLDFPTCDDRFTKIVGGNYARIPYSNSGGYDCRMDWGVENIAALDLQDSLVHCNGQSIVVDGSYGNATEQAVMNVQSAYGITVDGVYGPQTRHVMLWWASNTGSCLSGAYYGL